MANQPRHTANYLKNNRARLDKLTAANTAFKTFDALINAQGYFPSIRVDSFDGAAWLADCYDSAQMHRNDKRRACRSFTNTPKPQDCGRPHPQQYCMCQVCQDAISAQVQA